MQTAARGGGGSRRIASTAAVVTNIRSLPVDKHAPTRPAPAPPPPPPPLTLDHAHEGPLPAARGVGPAPRGARALSEVGHRAELAVFLVVGLARGAARIYVGAPVLEGVGGGRRLCGVQPYEGRPWGGDCAQPVVQVEEGEQVALQGSGGGVGTRPLRCTGSSMMAVALARSLGVCSPCR
jgi:hypothetical protein